MATEDRRVEALHACAILDTAPHPAFDCLTRAAALALRAPIALVSLLDTDRQWFKSVMGLPVRETPRSISFCNHTIGGFDPLIVEDTLEDPRFAQNPLVTGAPYIRFYAGVPLIDPEGFALGTLCILDYKPRTLSPDEICLLESLADAVMHAIAAHVQGQEVRRLTRKLDALIHVEEHAGGLLRAG